MAVIRTHRELQIASSHVSAGEILVARQSAIVSKLARAGHPTALAATLLRTFESTLERHKWHRDLIASELMGRHGRR
jgi:hypothetical protein